MKNTLQIFGIKVPAFLETNRQIIERSICIKNTQISSHNSHEYYHLYDFEKCSLKRNPRDIWEHEVEEALDGAGDGHLCKLKTPIPFIRGDMNNWASLWMSEEEKRLFNYDNYKYHHTVFSLLRERGKLIVVEVIIRDFDMETKQYSIREDNVILGNLSDLEFINYPCFHAVHGDTAFLDKVENRYGSNSDFYRKMLERDTTRLLERRNQYESYVRP
jgi:hypothetical protein